MKIIESPREGMQGLERFIPTEHKVKYINAVLKAGFDTVEAGSSVSPRAIPQMRDTMDVIRQLDLTGTTSKVMVLQLSLIPFFLFRGIPETKPEHYLR
jgi:hydroxymethylglutaryl-CoA lyase